MYGNKLLSCNRVKVSNSAFIRFTNLNSPKLKKGNFLNQNLDLFKFLNN